MAIKNGTWNIITMKLCPGSMGMRHFVPLLFVLSLIALPILGIACKLFWIVLLFELLVYFALDIYFSIKLADGIEEFLWVFILFPIFHVTYGVGSLNGLIKIVSKNFY